MKQFSLVRGDQWSGLYIIIYFGIAIALGSLIINDFSSPLSGMTGFGSQAGVNHDYVDIQEYKGFYFAKNLSFNPFPHLNLVHNQVFYPYGTNHVFNPWSIEEDLFYAAFYSLFGVGPWLPIYYLLTVLITAIGTFLLLKRDYGLARAGGAGFLLSFGNFYAIYKYPHHLPLSAIHWITLGLIVDFLIVKRVALKKPVSLRLVLVRACLLFLLFGHDLGYIAGLGLMSFSVSLLFIIILIGHRYFAEPLSLPEQFRRVIAQWKNDFLFHPQTCLALLGLSLVVGFLYLPLGIQIARAAKSFDLTGTNISIFWINPLRLFLPLFPIPDQRQNNFESLFHDSPETLFDGRAGWFLLILGAIGLWQNRHRIVIFVPLLITFGLCLLYIPGKIFVALTLRELFLLTVVVASLWLTRKRTLIFVPLAMIFFVAIYLNPTLFLLPTLKLFPWFTFNRVVGRCTVIYPTILCLLALHLNFNGISLRGKRAIVTVLVVLACVELGTAYSLRSAYQQPEPLSKDFFAYMAHVKQQPGEAVFDWPFCVTSGGGADNICPYYLYNSGISSLSRFHEKKVMGHYFGRSHPSQVAPYFQAGWDKLFFPDDTAPDRQKRCFTQHEWSFFTDFFKFNDFAGINLYLDRLPTSCISEFYTRFGSPTAKTSIPGAGKVTFIPKSSELRHQVNLARGISLKLEKF
ncbi:hypothetical protein K9N68_04270 [Kovacikia minuta CCNUW1]|uniref:hypothetical protein n=1 Tax=Kovacikia minuta TaxID=2931930 RepID=UPI001CCC10AF|nr:hypothetical protein [Kovacikia minuta]UBF27188.1 hypothetical protein K9N68_04270 [Kovacikia minuta CCNUW1]